MERVDLDAHPPEDAAQPSPREPLLTCPRGLQGIAIDHDLVRLVSELAKEVRIGIRRSEERRHQGLPLNVVRFLLQARRRGIMRREKCGVAGVHDQDPQSHFTSAEPAAGAPTTYAPPPAW